VTPNGLIIKSPAKINWNLRVLGKREDAFHEIESLVSAVTLYDELTFEERGDSTIEVLCEHPEVPAGRGNLIWQAAALLSSKSGHEGEVTCRIIKRIPLGGGLGGGSSNAAATLLGLNRLWSLDWPIEKLMPLAAELGSDVAFFLCGGSGIISGRGEKVRPVKLPWHGWIVLMMPAFSISTPAVYGRWRADAEGYQDRPIEPGRYENTLEWMTMAFNMLEKPAMDECPDLRILVEKSSDLAGRPVRVSGSGSTIFTAFDERSQAEQFAARIGEELNIKTCVVQPLEQSVRETHDFRTECLR